MTPPAEGVRARAWWRRGGYLALVAIAVAQVWALYVFVPGDGPSAGYADKVVHFGLFAAPAALAVLLRLRWVVVLLLLHAVASEPLQALLTSYREPDVWDTVADGVGIVIGVALARQLRGGEDRQPTRARS